MSLMDGVLFNAYPDSCGGSLKDVVQILGRDELRDVFSQFYILPSLFQSDLDRGFCVVSYDLNDELAAPEDLSALREMDMELLLDFVLNHLSLQSPQFKDLLEKGDNSEYIDFFIDWNKFWEGKGELSPEGYIIPREEFLNKLFMRKPGLPILKVPFPDGSERFYWNTFYQKVTEDEKGLHFLGQMDLNGKSELCWNFYEDTLKKMKGYGASSVRLDAFAYLHKEPGQSNFFNVPGTWEYLDRLRKMADQSELTLLPEIHSKYEEGIHAQLADRGFPIYDFFFPGLIIHTIESGNPEVLIRWIREILDKGYKTVNMLGCHDGIPALDVKGLLDEEQIGNMMSLIQGRGGRIKDLYGPDGKKISYYQINATFYSALGEDDKKLLLARAVQVFMPGTPLVWYLDLFAGVNDYDAADKIGHKDINRTNLSIDEMGKRLRWTVVRDQLKLLRFRNTFEAFGPEATVRIDGSDNNILVIDREKSGYAARLKSDLQSLEYFIEYKKPGGDWQIF